MRFGRFSLALWGAVLALAVSAPIAAGAPAAPAGAERALRAPTAEVEVVDVRESFGTRFYRFRQEVGGLPVLGADAVLADGPGGRGDLLRDRTVADIAEPAEAKLERAAAISAARRAAGVEELRYSARASLAILPSGDGQATVWRVILPAAEPLATFEVLIDARSGEVLGQRDLIRHATGSSLIFDTNPVQSQGSTAGLSDNSDNNSAALTAQLRARTLERLDDSSTCLIGRWARALLPSGDVCAAGRNFTIFDRQDDEFEAVMAYFHVDRTQAYIQSLGFTNILNSRVQVNANDFPDDNSFYDPGNGQISLGEGGVDDGEDAEVIYHEYGHAVQDDTRSRTTARATRAARWGRASATTSRRP